MRELFRHPGFHNLLEHLTFLQAEAAASAANLLISPDEKGNMEEFKERMTAVGAAKTILEEVSDSDYTFEIAELHPQIATSTVPTNEIRNPAGPTKRNSRNRNA